ncbi:hypothetical protein [Arthrobacter rhombi]|uniref:hypothetical protein n=1 Tax=Arthrobacter rhombi TaxID=71253 RepID=UPI003F93A5C6
MSTPDSGQPSAASSRPARVRVTAPEGAPLGVSRRRATHDPAAEFYVRSLIRSQLRLSLSVALGFLLLLLCLAVVVTFWPQIQDIRLLTIPLPWLVLGVGVYPIILLGAFLYNRVSARYERQYVDVTRE